ncbi:MAG: TerC family protein [Bacteroidetes bacterium]|nr:TerC family protein [Bacteroidota bacterium]
MTIVDVLLGVTTLTFMEIVLGIDNIIFIAIIANKLPKHEQPKARRIGLTFALVVRIILLIFITQLMTLKAPLFYLPLPDHPSGEDMVGISLKGLILLAGGVFLLIKSTLEIHEKITHKEKEVTTKGGNTMSKIILQIVLIDIVFSFDSILTAIGLAQDQVGIMIAAVVVSMIIMMFFSGPISNFINKHPTLQVLALSFLIMIGLMLVLEGLEYHFPKNYLYVAIAFSFGIELLNMRMRKNENK